MREILRRFYDALDREESKLARLLASDRLGLTMRVAINELDLDFEKRFEPGGGDDDRLERSSIMRLGVNRLIKLALEAHPRFDVPTLTFRRDPRLSASVLPLVFQAGTIDHGRRIAQALEAVSGRIEMVGDEFRIALPPEIVDPEVHERELDRYHRAREREHFAERFEAIMAAAIGNDVRSLLSELVYPFETHFIGYDSDPKIDAYFFSPAYNEIQLSKGYDTFHYLTKFGGLTFQQYKLAAAFIVSIGMRHRAYVRALTEKEPAIRSEDILTVSVKTEEFLESLEAFVDHFGEPLEGFVPLTHDGARTAFELLSVSRRNLAPLDRPGAPIPPLIQCSDDHVIRPLAGATEDVMLFLLNGLQQHFPKDYDRAQTAREGVLQRTTESLFQSVIGDLEFRTNVRLRRHGKVLTDIDLVAIEPQTGRVVLFQLKHQDPYGYDLAAKLNRTERLNRQVEGWIAKVRDWLGNADLSEIRAALRLPAAMSDPRVTLMVLTRHYAHSLRSIAEVDGIASANWNQLVTAAARIKQAPAIKSASIDGILAELRTLSMAPKEPHLPEPPSDWRVGDLHFSVVQLGSD